MTLIHGVFTVLLAIVFILPTGSCEKKKVNEKSKSGTSQGQTPIVKDSSVDDRRVSEGKWGGRHVRLDVSSVGADFEFDCAHGQMHGPLTLQNGRFAMTGTYVRERGRVRIDGKEEGLRAYFKGVVEGNKMTLTLSVSEDGSDAETFTLTQGSDGRLFKCK